MISLLYGLTLVLLPLYLWASGLPQIGHLVGVFWMAVTFLTARRFPWDKAFNYLVIFILYALIVDSFVFLKYLDYHTILSPIYYLYNFAFMYALILTARRMGNFRFFKYTTYLFLLLLVAQFLLNFSGLGRADGGYRAMGTFNDPNQFAHWVLWSVLIVAGGSFYIFRSLLLAWIGLGLGVVLLILSTSRSGLLGMSWVFLSLMLIPIEASLRAVVKGRVHFNLAKLMVKVIPVALLLVFSTGAIVHFFPGIQATISSHADFYVTRIAKGIQKSKENLEERGYDRLWKFPEYTVLGAGEGANYRWQERTTFLDEIHSTLAGLVFSYGIVGSFAFLGFIYHLWKRLPLFWLRLFLIAPFLYGLGTYNLRNTMFWLGLGFFWILADALRYETTFKALNREVLKTK